jgi:hypothetical protein
MAEEDVLDLARPDLVARDVDHVLDPVDQVEPALAVAHADVAGVQPAVLDRRRGLLGSVPVTGTDAGPAGEDLADLADRRRGAVLDPHNPRLGVGDRATDREGAGLGVDRRALAAGHHVRGRRRLGQAVGVVDVGAGRPLPALDDAGVDRSATAGDLGQRGEVAVAEARVIEHRDVGGQRADRVGPAPALDQPQDLARLEAMQQEQRRGAGPRRPQVADQAGDVEQGRHRHGDVAAPERAPGAHRLGVVDHRPVGVDRPLRQAGGAGGVGEEGRRVEVDLDSLPLPRPGGELLEVDAAGTLDPLQPRQHRWHLVEHVELGDGDHVLDLGPLPRRLDHREQRLEAEDDPRPGVAQLVAQLALLVHRVDRGDDAAAAPDGVDGDRKLGHVLQHHRHPVAGAQAELPAQRRSQRLGAPRRLVGPDLGVEVEKCRIAKALANRSFEQLVA